MPTDDWIAQVREGMDVYDSEGDKIGTVKDVFAGAGSDVVEGYAEGVDTVRRTESYPGDSILEDFAEVFDADDMPNEMRERLLQHGYIQIDGGLIGGDYYALVDQIAGVSREGVRLLVESDELVKV
ncbi:MAG: PRC-barrel domain-containing protein [Chloroflexota bacterium]|nr:PRC-barrel domain-containing protein [Chloroflexota bacterium]